MRVCVREDAGLSILSGENDRNDARRREGHLFDLGEVVVRVAVELQHAHVDDRVVAVRPHLGEVERVVPVLAGIFLRHDLTCIFHFEVTHLDRVEQVLLRGPRVRPTISAARSWSSAYDLQRLEVNHPVALVVRLMVRRCEP